MGVRRLYLSHDVRQLAVQKIWEKRALGRGKSEARAREQQDEATEDVQSSTYFNTASLRRHTARLVVFMDNLVCSWLTWSRTDAIKGLEVNATGETKTEHLVENANSSKCSMNAGRRGEWSECIARREAFCFVGFLFLTFIFLILKFHVTLQAVVLTNTDEIHFAAAMTFIWITIKRQRN